MNKKGAVELELLAVLWRQWTHELAEQNDVMIALSKYMEAIGKDKEPRDPYR